MVNNLFFNFPMNNYFRYSKFFFEGLRLRLNWASIELESNAANGIKIICVQRLIRTNGRLKKIKL